jgi:hypothetical protein
MGSPKDADQRPNIMEEFGDLSSELANYEEMPQGIVVTAHLGESKFVQFKEPIKSDGNEQIVEENEEDQEESSSDEVKSNRTGDYKV